MRPLKSLVRLRAFLDAEAKRRVQGDGIRPIEHVPFKIIRPSRQVRFARLCPFCRKTRAKILKLGAASFQGRLLEVWSDRAETRRPPGSAQGAFHHGMLTSH